MYTDAFLTGVAFGSGSLCGFIIVAFIWKATEYVISELPFYLYKIKEWLRAKENCSSSERARRRSRNDF